MNQGTKPGATTLAQVRRRDYLGLEKMPVDTLLDMYEETIAEIRLLPREDFKTGARRNGHKAIADALERMGIDAPLEIQRRAGRLAPYRESGMYLERRSRGVV